MSFVCMPLFSQQLLIILLIITLVLSIVNLVVETRLRVRKIFVFTASLPFLVTFICVFLLMRGSFLNRVGKSGFEPSLTALSLPFSLYCVITFICVFSAVSGIVCAAIWSRRHLSSVSIKESADKLPSGVCFYEESGLVRLANKKMNKLSVLLTGKALLNAADFWQNIESGKISGGAKAIKTGEEPIIDFGKEIYSFKRFECVCGKEKIFEIVAIDVTELYEKTRELNEKEAELKALNERLVSYGRGISALTKEKEILSAKIRIHDDMGKLLIATRKKLDGSLEKAEKEEIVKLWQREAEAFGQIREEEKDEIKAVFEAAKLVGVEMFFSGYGGFLSEKQKKILAAAMRECLTNTVAHADGKTMTVCVNATDTTLQISITNDGKRPEKDIVEGGGLGGLRKLVERAGGKMTVKSLPEFELKIELKRSDK